MHGTPRSLATCDAHGVLLLVRTATRTPASFARRHPGCILLQRRQRPKPDQRVVEIDDRTADAPRAELGRIDLVDARRELRRPKEVDHRITGTRSGGTSTVTPRLTMPNSAGRRVISSLSASDAVVVTVHRAHGEAPALDRHNFGRMREPVQRDGHQQTHGVPEPLRVDRVQPQLAVLQTAFGFSTTPPKR